MIQSLALPPAAALAAMTWQLAEAAETPARERPLAVASGG